MQATKQAKSKSTQQIPLQVASQDIWDTKYRLKDGATPVDQTVEDTYRRVAHALASVEKSRKAYWEGAFFDAMTQGAIPAGRILSNAGATAFKPATSTINCTVSGTIRDSMRDILEKNTEAGLTLKAGCGIGYEFSTLRPKGAFVAGAGAETSGPLSFMDMFDRMCMTIASAGGRRGAQMATFDITHPDVEAFIEAKREDGRLRQFNCSILITDEFVHAVEQDKMWPLYFPVREGEKLNDHDDVFAVHMPHLSDDSNITRDEEGKVYCKVYKTVKAKDLWEKIMRSTYDFAEPGFILVDRANQMNNNWFCEELRATNPCAEQFLPPYGSCLLGSINLTNFVQDAFTEAARFDWAAYKKVVRVFTRMLDNVVELNGLPLPQQRDEIERKRRHGMGYLGLGSAMTMMGIPYGSPDSVAFTEEVTQVMAVEGWREGLSLAKEKGPAPIMTELFEITPEMVAKRPELLNSYKLGERVEGRILWGNYSRYMQKIGEVEPELWKQLCESGARFTHHTSIAPTGTIALSLGNNVSNGIEPSFAHHYARNLIRAGKKTKEKIDVFSYELLRYRDLIEDKAMPYPAEGEIGLPEYFVVSDQITPEQHVDVQAAAQLWVDSSISKTINVPTEISYEAFKNIYTYAHSQGLKGCTTFRFNPEAFQGVLVKQDDLANTLYEFTLEDGSKVVLRGDEEVEYDGEMHNAANLYDALKEGTYGSY